MPALLPTDYTAKITWLGFVAQGRADIRSEAIQEVFASFAGVEGESHYGINRPACVRTVRQHPEGTEIRNVRQFSILSSEEVSAIAAEIGLDNFDPEWLGASLIIEGIPDFSHVPPSSRLQTKSGTTLVIDMQNRPCQYPAREIEKDRPGHGKAFKAAAKGRRGVTAWVEREGVLAVGDEVRLHIPDQRSWLELDASLSSDAQALAAE